MDIVVWKDPLDDEKPVQVSNRTSGVKCRCGTNTGPHDGRQAHRQGDVSNPIINVSEWGPHCVGRDTQDILDDFLAPAKLGDDLFVGEGGKGRRMTPGMNGDVVLGQILCLKDSRE